MKRMKLPAGACMLALLGTPGAGIAQNFPAKAVRLVVPYAAGGPTDVLARMAAQHVGGSLGGQMLVDNKPGGNTIVGAEMVAKAPPDGYMLFLTTGTAVSINQHLYKTLPYDPTRDFTAVGKLAANYYVLYANPALPASDIGSLVAYARANPGKLNAGAHGNATPTHFAVKLLESASGAGFTTVQYNGSPAAYTDLIGGRIDLVVDSPILGMTHVRAGKLKAIAVMSPKRFPTLPDIPAVAESYPGFEALSWFGIMAPSGTPRETIHKLNGAIQKFVADPVPRNQLGAQGMTLESGPPEALAAYIRAETAKWGALIKATGLKLE